MKKRAAGRPRDPNIGKTILRAASALMKSKGYFNVSMDLVAKKAGVGKHTLYRRWHSKAELAIAVFREQSEPLVAETYGLEAFCLLMAKLHQETGPTLRALLAEAQMNVRTRASVKKHLIKPRRKLLESLFRSRFPNISDLEVEARISLINGAFWYRLMLDLPLDEATVKAIVHAVTSGSAGELAFPETETLALLSREEAGRLLSRRATVVQPASKVR